MSPKKFFAFLAAFFAIIILFRGAFSNRDFSIAEMLNYTQKYTMDIDMKEFLETGKSFFDTVTDKREEILNSNKNILIKIFYAVILTFGYIQALFQFLVYSVGAGFIWIKQGIYKLYFIIAYLLGILN